MRVFEIENIEGDNINVVEIIVLGISQYIDKLLKNNIIHYHSDRN